MRQLMRAIQESTNIVRTRQPSRVEARALRVSIVYRACVPIRVIHLEH
jgi:hypothetical protein